MRVAKDTLFSPGSSDGLPAVDMTSLRLKYRGDRWDSFKGGRLFAASPVTTSTDSRWSLHTTMSFAHGRGGELTEYLPLLEAQEFYAIEYPDGGQTERTVKPYPLNPNYFHTSPPGHPGGFLFLRRRHTRYPDPKLSPLHEIGAGPATLPET
jgi:hypothetical protein